jgi:hypothetical protein
MRLSEIPRMKIARREQPGLLSVRVVEARFAGITWTASTGWE